jgi:hypothetical protein
MFVLTLRRQGLPEADPSKAPQLRSLLFVKLAKQGSTVLATRAVRRTTKWLAGKSLFSCL